MSISQIEIDALIDSINKKLEVYKSQFVLTFHFSLERLNDIRNKPPITLLELESIFSKVIENHISAILVLNDTDTFNIKCETSHINMPCEVKKESKQTSNTVTHKNIVITIMRKKSFVAHNGDIEFLV